MTPKFLLDTNVLSEPLRPAPDARILAHLEAHQAEIATASVVWHELLFGCHRLPDSQKRRAIEEFLHRVIRPSIPILPYDEVAAHWHAAERARLSAQGKTPPFADGQIAAIAATRDLTLVTANRGDFAGYEGLQVVDWRNAGW